MMSRYNDTPIADSYAWQVTRDQAFLLSQKERTMRSEGKSEAEIENSISNMVVWFLSKNSK